ncbi:hypothetical protein [Methylomonas sp. TEB]|uniref:hypothetical protein n=1 Tax=Methylomonas sp. TEB TaxID=3398229 RepID=UPI0039F59E67
MNTKFFSRRLLAVLALLALGANTASAELISRRGGTMIYDSDTNLTWLADANLLRKQLAQDPDLVGKIIQSVGTVYTNWGDIEVKYDDFIDQDYPYLRDGKVTLIGARAWASYLDYGGFDDWRLPEDGSGCTGYYCYFYSEMGSLLYEGLLGRPGVPIDKAHGPNYGLFENIQIGTYWLGNDDRTSARISSYSMYTHSNFQSTTLYRDGFNNRSWYLYGHAWAVRQGDVGDLPAVPLPSSAWLFLTSLLPALQRWRR